LLIKLWISSIISTKEVPPAIHFPFFVEDWDATPKADTESKTFLSPLCPDQIISQHVLFANIAA